MLNSSHKASFFFGREDISAILDKRLDSFLKGYRQNIGLIGPPLVGKTAILTSFADRISSRKEIITILFSCQEFDSFERFSEKWMAELLSAFQHSNGHPPFKNVQVLFKSVKHALPKTFARMRSMKRLVTKRRFDQAFHELLSLTSLLQEESGKKIIMILDNFDRLGELGLRDPFSTLGKEIMVQKETMFLFSGSRQTRSAAIFREKLSLLFSNFEVIKIGALEARESRELVNSYSALSKTSDETKNFLIRMTDGHPYYLTILARRFESCASFPLHNERKLLIGAFESELFASTGTIHQYFKSLLHHWSQNRPWTFTADILTAVSLGYKKPVQAARFLGLKSTDIKKALEKMYQLEAIEKHGSFYQITDTLLRLWLDQVYYRERFWAKRSPLVGAKSFAEDLDELIEEHVREDREELPKRISSLFLKFQNDSVEIEGKKFNCPHFTEVVYRPNNGRVFPVLAKNSRVRWLCQILSHHVAEEDIQTFLLDAKHHKAPFQKKLVIGLRGIDLNAKLLAQEAKIQYFDLKTLNQLFDLFDKPKLVL